MRKNYESPVIKLVTVEVEKGFAASKQSGTLEGFGPWESGVSSQFN